MSKVSDYAPVAQITSLISKSVSLTDRLPWVYVIAGLKDKVVYVGETYDREGILIRLGSHFGPYVQSTLKKRASERAVVSVLSPPYLVVAARLPFAEDDAGFDGTATMERRFCEAAVHQLVMEHFVLKTPGWVIVSETSVGANAYSATIDSAAAGIFTNFLTAFQHYRSLAATAPFHFVILDPFPHAEKADYDVGRALDAIETSMFTWVINRLQRQHGESWWREAVPTEVRVECQARLERDATAGDAPAEAYMMLLDLKAIAKKNWSECGTLMEAVSGAKGRDAAMAWIQDLNDIRNLWAHPIRRKFTPMHQERIAWLRNLGERCFAACRA